jgi:hypothetical protein
VFQFAWTYISKIAQARTGRIKDDPQGCDHETAPILVDITTLRTPRRSDTRFCCGASLMDPIDFEQHTAAELLDILHTVHPQRAGENFIRLKTALEARGFLIKV